MAKKIFKIELTVESNRGSVTELINELNFETWKPEVNMLKEFKITLLEEEDE